MVQQWHDTLLLYCRFPSGWYRACSCSDVAKGQVKALQVLELELVAFRTQGGKIAVTAAHCPHLGAHLAIGGTVVGECIECPFHKWQFDTGMLCFRTFPLPSSPVYVYTRNHTNHMNYTYLAK
jgi:nitrite reductase/ring-hydroxylating ferredoxin subunit